MIPPTIGREVWFQPNGTKPVADGKPIYIFADQPLDATVVCVWGDRIVNLTVADHGGQVHAFRSVTLRQDGDAVPIGHYCEWMPHQAAKAKQASASS